MNKSLFLSLSVGCIGVVAALLGAAPAYAQDRLPATGYCTGETVQISGWETDLVRRNKGLEKFHWSAINTVQHYNVVPAASAQHGQPRQLSPYHNSKPTVVSNWSNPHASVADRTCIASTDGARTNVGASLRHNSTNTYAQLARGYESSGFGAQQAQYATGRAADSQVSGRVMHY